MNKYGAIKTTLDGITFDSAREASRWGQLVLLQRLGKIRDLQRQVPFRLIPAEKGPDRQPPRRSDRPCRRQDRCPRNTPRWSCRTSLRTYRFNFFKGPPGLLLNKESPL